MEILDVFFLPPNTTSLIQPMDQGIIHTCKRYYRKRYLEQCLAVLEDDVLDAGGDMRGQRTLANLKAYNIKDSIFNLSGAWNDLKGTTLRNCWKLLLDDIMTDLDFVGFTKADFRSVCEKAGDSVSEVDIRNWLDCDDDDDGGHNLSEQEIVDQVTGPLDVTVEVEEDSNVEADTSISYSTACSHLDDLLLFLDSTRGEEYHTMSLYNSLRNFQRRVIVTQHKAEKQTKISQFFKRPSVFGLMKTRRKSDSSCSDISSIDELHPIFARTSTPSTSSRTVTPISPSDDEVLMITPEPPENIFADETGNNEDAAPSEDVLPPLEPEGEEEEGVSTQC